MNFNKKQNEFCGIPGFDASRGERIAKALKKLWEKIQYLEQTKMSEESSKSKVSHSSNEEDLTLTDVQYKLLSLQLQYVRSVLKKKGDPSSEFFLSTINGAGQKCPCASERNNRIEDELNPDIINRPAPSDTQTASNFIYPLNSTSKVGSSEDESKNVQVVSDNQSPKIQHSTKDSTTAYQRTIPSTSKPHYHLNLKDVPFILGASATASHSVVANVQNIIAMMKPHNKALCGPKSNVTRSAVSNCPDLKHSTDFKGESSQDIAKMLNDLTRDLNALTARQQKLAERYDATQRKKLGHEVNSAKSIQNQESKSRYEHAENKGSRKHRSISESDIKLGAEVNRMPNIKEKDFVRHHVHAKQLACNMRSQQCNLSIMDRRKLLRSLQTFKKQLSEEDISWN